MRVDWMDIPGAEDRHYIDHCSGIGYEYITCQSSVINVYNQDAIAEHSWCTDQSIAEASNTDIMSSK